jgi:TPP-dependent indolepyruvate ferredoxin oxidoreductase alpha subunit
MGGFCLASERLALIQVSEIGIRLARQRGGMRQKSRRKPAWLALHQMPARGASYNDRFGIADRGVSMAAVMPLPAASRVLMSGNEAVARAVWEAGVRVAAAYPGTPSTEMLEVVATYPDLYAEWSVNEKVSLEVAIGAAYAGSRAFCCMKHVGMNVASDALMTLTLTGVIGGLVIAIADDVGLSSSQNEQDSRYWGRFAHVPVLEPADSQEAYAMTLYGYELSEKFRCRSSCA